MGGSHIAPTLMKLVVHVVHQSKILPKALTLLQVIIHVSANS